MSLRSDAAALQGDLAELRRDLHQIPEIGLDLPRTQERVLAALHPLPLEVTTGTGLTSITAVLRGGKPGPVVLLRGDMDALPVTESPGLALHLAARRRDARVRPRPAHRRAGRRRPAAGRAAGRRWPATSSSCSSRARRASTAPAHMIAEGVLDAAGRPVDYGVRAARDVVGACRAACSRPGAVR